MSRSALFDRLGRLVALARFAREEGLSHAGEIRQAAASRREVLQGAVALAGLSALAPMTTGCTPTIDPATLRVGIVGGGIAGVHCAYRLKEAGVAALLFESSDRLGGRMWTGRDLFLDDQVFEIGGELIDSNHATLWALADELDIALDDRLAAPFDTLRADTWWVNDAAVPDDTLLEQLVLVLPDIEADYDAAENTDDGYAALDAETLEDWLDRRVPVTVARELHDVLSVAYRGEFGLENDEQSALNLIYLLGLDDTAFRIFGDSDERYHTHDGNDTYITRLAEALDTAQVRLGHTFVSASGDGPYTLVFDTEDGQVTEEVDHVVFALPFTRLRQCDLDDLDLSELKREIISDLGYGTNAKVMAGFSRPVWREDHDASGSLTCDLPVQQTWDTSIGQAGASAILTNFLGGDQGVASAEGTADAWIRDVALPGLETVFPGCTAAYTGTAHRMHWPTHAHTLGSYTCYRPGQWAYWALEGERERDLHFCGEHTSADFQGWMEGGAESGARAAEEIVGDYNFETSEASRRLRQLRASLPPIDRQKPLSSLRARRRVFRAFVASLRGEGRG